MSSLEVNSTSGSPLSVSGLASGLNTSAIISALLAAEKEPITHLTTQSEKLSSQEQVLQTITSSVRQLELAVSEFTLPTAYETAQSVTSSGTVPRQRHDRQRRGGRRL